jgi:hypothetical protein
MIRYGALFFLILLLSNFALADTVLNDPTKPADQAPSAVNSSGLMVNMIIIGSKNARASVNGKMVKVGEEINGAKVIAIERTAVKFSKADNSEFLVPLHSYIVKEAKHESKK